MDSVSNAEAQTAEQKDGPVLDASALHLTTLKTGEKREVLTKQADKSFARGHDARVRRLWSFVISLPQKSP